MAATGRLSSVDPNLQNIPNRNAVGREIRSVFVPGEGYEALMSCDYSQVELRIMADLSGDEALIEHSAPVRTSINMWPRWSMACRWIRLPVTSAAM